MTFVEWFDGKKTTLASLYWSVMIPSMAIYFPEGAPPELERALSILGLILTWVGLGHKAIKSSKGVPK